MFYTKKWCWCCSHFISFQGHYANTNDGKKLKNTGIGKSLVAWCSHHISWKSVYWFKIIRRTKIHRHTDMMITIILQQILPTLSSYWLCYYSRYVSALLSYLETTLHYTIHISAITAIMFYINTFSINNFRIQKQWILHLIKMTSMFKHFYIILVTT